MPATEAESQGLAASGGGIGSATDATKWRRWQVTGKQKGPACPSCGTASAVRIVYGLPSSDAGEAEDRGEIALGGCCIDEDCPIWSCRNCGHRWGRLGGGSEGRREPHKRVRDEMPAKPDAPDDRIPGRESP